MEFRRVDRDEIDKLVTMRMLYLREDFSNVPDAYFCRIEKEMISNMTYRCHIIYGILKASK